MRKLSVWMTGVCVGSVIASAQASEPATNPATSSDEVAASSVQISATRDPELKSYRQLLKGLNAYESHLAKAPGSVFRFQLIPQKSDVSLHDVGLRIVSDDSSIPIPVANDGGFTLPRDKKAETDNADLLTNQKKGSFRWRPEVRSAGLTANTRRLGDLRLECEIRWAVEYDELPFLRRNMFRAAGGPCHSSMITVIYFSPFKSSTVTLVSGERKMVLTLLADGLRYSPPLHEQSWNDDAVIVFEPVAQQ
ncbi:hypothetical protein [Undibacterium aquatile]|uniref:Outer membrane lipoprotein-sorting protein n=1 Tax=Undibacterium aquatile TaxID=1537398 RepID=A0ABR6XGQ0_9BURK|nr:hypothetical protein [Undibacterium aquatile]MBC3812090.1 hypothetical protein [Undibacterium aquatile]